MPRVIAIHDVDDVEHWLAPAKHDEIFMDVAFNMVTFVRPSDPNKAGLSADIPDLDKFLAVNSSPVGVAAMEHDGVRLETIVVAIEP